MLQVGCSFAKLARVAVDDYQLSAIAGNPLLVAAVEPFEIIQTDGLLVLPSPFLYLRHYVRYAAAYVNHQVGQPHERHHEVEQVGIVGKVAVAHVALLMQVWCEYLCILKDGAVLYDYVVGLGNLHHLFETAVEEIDLQVERPPLHVAVEVGKIWVVVNRLEAWCPSVSSGQQLGKCGLTASYVSGNGYVHEFFVFFSIMVVFSVVFSTVGSLCLSLGRGDRADGQSCPLWPQSPLGRAGSPGCPRRWSAHAPGSSRL